VKTTKRKIKLYIRQTGEPVVCPRCRRVWELVGWGESERLYYYSNVPRYGKRQRECPQCAGVKVRAWFQY